eukprot:CAMPEP_0170592588 /NCGR_PEP_ID=MMETSP0224-20130122/13002_1 /TAXON_ID=285029 /ORGANISM="Togula jolla, Strain CCCM 725" /LENGTH=125 /DNA_ID=CAMNT_0010916499 /DNA_START=72 /DNA_END=446 /DNA_ORIENTATION=+
MSASAAQPAVANAVFNMLDRNGDGAVSKQEFDAAMAQGQQQPQQVTYAAPTQGQVTYGAPQYTSAPTVTYGAPQPAMTYGAPQASYGAPAATQYTYAAPPTYSAQPTYAAPATYTTAPAQEMTYA